jgi:lysozyme family protein
MRLREELQSALVDVVNRLNVATEAKEEAALSAARDQLQQQFDLVVQQGLLAAAAAVATATAALQDTIATAHTDPIQQFVGLINDHLEKLGATHAVIHTAVAPTPAPALPAEAPANVTAVSHSVQFDDLAAEYTRMFEACLIRPDKVNLVQQGLGVLRGGQPRYAAVAAPFTNMPWYFVGIIHGLEGSFNFKVHLHNGDPLTARTVHVPAGRPTGTPPFSWEASAQDALGFAHFERESDFTVPRILFLFERFNGMGYRRLGVATPYLWSFSNHYVKGKFSQDGKFDRELMSRQIGAAVLLGALRDAGELIA